MMLVLYKCLFNTGAHAPLFLYVQNHRDIGSPSVSCIGLQRQMRGGHDSVPE